MAQIADTGERLLPQEMGNTPEAQLHYLFHEATYRFALPHIQGKRILEFGCGTGYGTYTIAPEAEHITAVDISADAIDFAREHHAAPNVDYQTVGDIEHEPIPFEDDTFESIISFQVIEHIEQDSRYVEELKRVLKPGGALVIATPDRDFRLFFFQKPWNGFHIREYSDQSLRSLLKQSFANVKIFKMGCTDDSVQLELQRTNKIRWMTLPFTLPIVPEFIRRPLLVKLMSRKKESRKDKSDLKRNEMKLSLDQIQIKEGTSPSVNLIAVATK